MVQINFGQREVSCKVVFYGPGMSGKTTNLEIIHKKAPKDAVGEMVSIATETDRTLYFDFLPLDLGQVAGMRTRFQLYTVPGQIYYNATRKLVLQGVDGVIFVADSNPEKMAENLESLQNLRDNLAEMNLTLNDLPLVLQYNKRDLPNALSIADMNAQMNPMNAPTYEACARDGKGVFATLKEISRLVIEKLNKEHAPAANRRRTNNANGSSNTPGTMPAPVPPPTTPSPMRGAPAVPPPATPLPQMPPRGMVPPPPRPSPPPAAGARPNTASGSRSAVPTGPSQPTPARGAPAISPVAAANGTPRDKHLAKSKPPTLDNRREPDRIEPSPTDPNLKRYQLASSQTSQSGGALKMLVLILVVMLICILLLMVAVLFVPQVRALLPQSLQHKLGFGGELNESSMPTPAPQVLPTPAQPVRAPAPAPAAPQVPAAPQAPSTPAAPIQGAPNGQ